eukprot:scaffold78793_cov31-Prasinocladus_malaysianus.AAC.1
MLRRPSAVGSGTYRILSRRPGRSRAGSIMSGRLVAAIKYTACIISERDAAQRFQPTNAKKKTAQGD